MYVFSYVSNMLHVVLRGMVVKRYLNSMTRQVDILGLHGPVDSTHCTHMETLYIVILLGLALARIVTR